MGCRGSGDTALPRPHEEMGGLFVGNVAAFAEYRCAILSPVQALAQLRNRANTGAQHSQPDHPGSAVPTRYPQPLPPPLCRVAPGAESRYAGVKVRGLAGLSFTRIARPSVCNPPPLPAQNAEDCSRITPRARGYSESVVGRRCLSFPARALQWKETPHLSASAGTSS